MPKPPAEYKVRSAGPNEWLVDKVVGGHVANTYHVMCYKTVWECDPNKCEAAKYGKRFSCKHIDIVKDALGVPEDKTVGSQCFQYALNYLERGWSVIPIKHRDKTPLIKWQPYQKRRAEKAKIVEWWDRWPNAGVAVITGKISDIVVVDIDQAGLGLIREAGLASIRTLTHGTGRGMHYIFKYPDEEVRNTVNLWKGIDFRGDGGYIVAPPSIHANGAEYRVAHQVPIAVLPAELLERVKDEKDERHPFVATPNKGKCSSCGQSRTRAIHKYKEED